MNVISNRLLIENAARIRDMSTVSLVLYCSTASGGPGIATPTLENLQASTAKIAFKFGVSQGEGSESITAYARPYLYWKAVASVLSLPTTSENYYEVGGQKVYFEPGNQYMCEVGGSTPELYLYNGVEWKKYATEVTKFPTEVVPVLYNGIWYRLVLSKSSAITNHCPLLFVRRRVYAGGEVIDNRPNSLEFNQYALVSFSTSPFTSGKTGLVFGGSGMTQDHIVVAYDSLPQSMVLSIDAPQGLLFTYVFAL